MKKLLARKKNNKGFSLVELIVVILIMAIIAVALAPQVMKWVGESSKSTDANNMATIKSAVSAAVADFQGDGKKLEAATFYVVEGGLKDSTDVKKDPASPKADLRDYILEVMNGDFPAVKDSANGKVFKIEITATGSVKVSYDNTVSYK